MGLRQKLGQQGPARGRMGFFLRLVTAVIGTVAGNARAHEPAHHVPPPQPTTAMQTARPLFGVLHEPEEILQSIIGKQHHVCWLAVGSLLACLEGLAKYLFLDEHVPTVPHVPFGKLQANWRRPINVCDLNSKRPFARLQQVVQEPVTAGHHVSFSIAFSAANLAIVTLCITTFTHTYGGPRLTRRYVHVVVGSFQRMKKCITHIPPTEVESLRAANEALQLEVRALELSNERLEMENKTLWGHRVRANALEQQLHHEREENAQLLLALSEMVNQHTDETQRLTTQKHDAEQRAAASEQAASMAQDNYNKLVTRTLARMQRNRHQRALRRFVATCRALVHKQQINRLQAEQAALKSSLMMVQEATAPDVSASPVTASSSSSDILMDQARTPSPRGPPAPTTSEEHQPPPPTPNVLSIDPPLDQQQQQQSNPVTDTMAPPTQPHQQQQQQQPQQTTEALSMDPVPPSTPPPTPNGPQQQPQQAPSTSGSNISATDKTSRKSSWAAVARLDTHLRKRSTDGGQQQKQSTDPPTTAPLSPSSPPPTRKPTWLSVARAITHAPTLNAEIVRRRMQQQPQFNPWAAPQQHPRRRASSLPSSSASATIRTATTTSTHATVNNTQARESKTKGAVPPSPAPPAPEPTTEPKPTSGVLLQCIDASAMESCTEYLAGSIMCRADVVGFKELERLNPGDWWMAPCIHSMFAELVMSEFVKNAPPELRAAVVTDPLLYNTLTDEKAKIDKGMLNANLCKLKFRHGSAYASNSVQADQSRAPVPPSTPVPLRPPSGHKHHRAHRHSPDSPKGRETAKASVPTATSPTSRPNNARGRRSRNNARR